MKNYTLDELRHAIDRDKAKGIYGYGHIDIETDKGVFFDDYDEFYLVYPSAFNSRKTFGLKAYATDIRFEFNTLKEVSDWLINTYC